MMTNFSSEKNATEQRVDVAYLAMAFRLTTQGIYKLISAGILHPEKKGRYRNDQKTTFILPQAIQEYIDFKSQGKEQVDYYKEKALHEQANRKMAEIRLAKMEHRMHDAEDIEQVMGDMLSNIRTRILGISKLAPQLVGCSQEEIADLLSKEGHNALMELSDYSPTMFDIEPEEVEDDETEDT